MVIGNDGDNRERAAAESICHRDSRRWTPTPLLRMLRCSVCVCVCVCLCNVMCECGGRTTRGKDQWRSVRMHSWRAPSSITSCCFSQVCVCMCVAMPGPMCAWHRKDWEHRRTSLSSIHSSCICFQHASVCACAFYGVSNGYEILLLLKLFPLFSPRQPILTNCPWVIKVFVV